MTGFPQVIKIQEIKSTLLIFLLLLIFLPVLTLLNCQIFKHGLHTQSRQLYSTPTEF